MSEESPQFHSLTVELLLDKSTGLDPDAIEAAVRRTLPESRLVGGSPGVTIAHDRFTHTHDDGNTAPVMTLILGSGMFESPSEIDLSQTWTFPNADEAVAGSTDRVLVTEMMGMFHEPADRVTAFTAVLRAAIELLRPIAIWSANSQHLIEPDDFVDDEPAALMNVRMFRVEPETDVLVMDTIGLHVLGLPDIQCHFRGLEPSDMANALYSTALYVLEAGDVIEDGNTISGIEGTERWRCQHEMALVAPERIVLDIDTGKRHAAGDRNRATTDGARKRWWPTR